MAGFRTASDVMSPIDVEVLIGVVTFIVSVGVSMFVSGTRWGRVEEKVNVIEKKTQNIDNMQTDMAVMKHDLAEIKGMFTMRLKDAP